MPELLDRKDIQWIQMCSFGASIFSTCSKSQFMCIIIDKHGRVAGLGYNGVPSGMKHCSEGGCPRYVNNVPSGTSYDYGDGLCFSGHAEQNALSHGDGTRYSEATLYINGFPCLTCAKGIASAGVKRVVCVKEQNRLYADTTMEFLNRAGVELLEAEL